jgi:CarD family transcriptional regulator
MGEWGTGSRGPRAVIRMTAPTSALPRAFPAPAPPGGPDVGRPGALGSGAVERGAARTAKVDNMQFEAGQTVIHPQHGPATVVEVFSRSVNGASTDFIGLRVHRSDLRIGVPVDRADEVGLRPVSAAAQVAGLLEVLRAPTGEQEETWSRRFKANQEKLRIGDLFVTAGVVRDLTRRQEARGLSLDEKDQLEHARVPILAELALALSLADEEAERLLTSAIHGDQDAGGPEVLATAS